jgi:hypothetical protein
MHVEKTNFIKFCTNNACVDLSREYGNKAIKYRRATKFLGLQSDYKLSLEARIVCIYYP